ncbi:hypothetical protein BpHYR1_038739 [Brachionus plicatilis]|uniref:Uncharacterized protein n=1 Tax=Brachionus plicatilis TaxID=10195 RepID=A0A3M7RL65_BRAPC|nr:hypothetical protein BpHYR1_038739 [Brachionus plicatilis]
MYHKMQADANQVMVRCYPSSLNLETICKFLDILRTRIGPIRYARFLAEHDRVYTVSFIEFMTKKTPRNA